MPRRKGLITTYGTLFAVKTLGRLGEREAIRVIDGIVNSKVEIGIGDDCAALDVGDRYLLITTDMMAAKTHVPKGMSPYDIGWTLVAINLSDIAAMGGIPEGVVAAIGITRGHPIDYLEQIVDGMNDCAQRFGTSIVGGDTKEHDSLTLCGTAIGHVKKDEILLRKGAKSGDLVVVSGELGTAGAGYFSLKRSLGLSEAEGVLKRPWPRIKEARVLASSGVVTSCMDISDGLSSSIYELSKNSGLTYEIDYASIPKAKEVEMAFHDTERQKSLVLNFGDDFELLFTVNRESEEELRRLSVKADCPFSVIGKVTSGEENILVDDGKREKLENLGYEHFRTRQS